MLVYSSYLGGSDWELGRGIAVDFSGTAYVTGETNSVNLTPVNASQPSNAGNYDAFITKLTPAGVVIYSTYLGGSLFDMGNAIATEGASAYVTGVTTSANFPTTPSAFQGAIAAQSDVFVTKLDSVGAIAYSTFLGGSTGGEYGTAIAVDGSGAAHVSGFTNSTDFDTTTGPPSVGNGDAFVTKFTSNGTSLAYSTYLGGSDEDTALGIALDATGAAYVTGYTFSANFPAHAPFALLPYQVNRPAEDGFVTKFDLSGTRVYSTYLGGSGEDIARGIAVDASNAAYVTGETESTNFPLQGPYQSNLGLQDSFVTKLNATGSGAIYSTYLGGSLVDGGAGIAVDGNNAAYVAGWTESTVFGSLPPSPAQSGSTDIFVAKLTPTGASLSYLTFRGGSSMDVPQAMAVDGNGAVYVTGWTHSTDFPMQAPFQGTGGGAKTDALVFKLSGGPPPTCGGHIVTLQVATSGLTTNGTTGVDVIRGTNGADIINGLSGNDFICGLGGSETLSGNGGDDDVYGNDGADKLSGNAGADDLHGLAHIDSLSGDAGIDNLYGEGGNDYLYAGTDNDFAAGGLGDDFISGGQGADLVYGHPGKDRLNGDAGNDTLKGLAQDDTLNGGPHFDNCDGGFGFNDSGVSCEIQANIP